MCDRIVETTSRDQLLPPVREALASCSKWLQKWW